MSTNDGFQGVSNCYVFKSRLQEYAQKVGLPTPVYETIKEGPSHEPSFRSTVIVNDVRYDSMPGFFNRKAAEQSAAEVALVELFNTGETTDCISQPVHETGLCKNLLQEYAQKMNYAIPSYECRKDETPGRVPLFSCTVEIGGIKYIGAAARTKKEAEIKAARTSLLAIQSSPSGSYEKDTGNSMYTVIPCKKKATDSGISTQETTTLLKPKKGRFKKKPRKKRRAGEKDNHIQVESMDKLEVNIDGHEGQQLDQADASGVQAANSGLLTMEGARNFQDQTPRFDGNEGDKSSAEGALVPYHNGDAKDGQLTALDCYPIVLGPPNHGISSIFNGDGLTSLVSEVNTIPGIGQVASMVNSSSVCQEEVQRVTDGLNQTRQVEAVPGQTKGASVAD